MLTPEQEKLIIARAKTDPPAFGPLYEAHFNVVFGFIFKRLRDQEATAELTSMVFLKALHALPRYEWTGAPFSSWLISIALNETRLYFRRNKTDVTVPISETDVTQLREELNNDEDLEQSLARLADSLGRLESEEQELIELRFFEHYSFAQMGEILSISSDNAKTRTYRALARLRTLMLKAAQ